MFRSKIEQSYDHSKQSNRLLFIDVMRAYAILMMIQGHMIDAMIDPIYRDSSNFFFSLWDQMRGVTAPVFFFSSGTIFSYLLLRKNLPLMENERFFKGIKRVFILLVIAYLLRFNPGMLFSSSDFNFEMYKNTFAVDALHCIAIGLGMILLSYLIHKLTHIYIWILYLGFAFTAFYLLPNMLHHNWSDYPIPFASYFTKNYGSNFPIIPWTGFVLWGALLGYLLSKKANLAFNNLFALSMLILGILLHYYSGTFLIFLYDITGDSNFDYLLHHNYLYYHLGNSFIVLGVLGLYSNNFRIPKILSSVGKKTMMIYVVHIFIIYGTGYNKGLQYYYGKSLGPWESVFAAIAILLFFIFLVHYVEKAEPYFQKKFPKLFPSKKII